MLERLFEHQVYEVSVLFLYTSCHISVLKLVPDPPSIELEGLACLNSLFECPYAVQVYFKGIIQMGHTSEKASPT
jgi:hypothetical protein